MNIFDMLAVLPFYVEVYHGASDFTILPSSPQNYLTVLTRSFKVLNIRRFDSIVAMVADR
jgi:hypothetical protein